MLRRANKQTNDVDEYSEKIANEMGEYIKRNKEK